VNDRWPLDPLIARLGPAHTRVFCRFCHHDSTLTARDCVTHTDLAAAVHVSRRTVQRWARHGLSDTAADRAAIALGVHPAQVWPGWVAVGLTPTDDAFINGTPQAEPGWRQAALHTPTPEETAA